MSEMSRTLDESFPLWINPWVSGIYALYDPLRSGSTESADGMIPAVLTSYCDEFGDANLLMHVLDYSELTGGRIVWSPFAGVRWRGGNAVELYKRDDEGWNFRFLWEKSLSEDEVERLPNHQELCRGDRTESESRIVAEALLPHLPFGKELRIWDRTKTLACPNGPIEDMLHEPEIRIVLERGVLPLGQLP